jgi:hypothetical protein
MCPNYPTFSKRLVTDNFTTITHTATRNEDRLKMSIVSLAKICCPDESPIKSTVSIISSFYLANKLPKKKKQQ